MARFELIRHVEENVENAFLTLLKSEPGTVKTLPSEDVVLRALNSLPLRQHLLKFEVSQTGSTVIVTMFVENHP